MARVATDIAGMKQLDDKTCWAVSNHCFIARNGVGKKKAMVSDSQWLSAVRRRKHAPLSLLLKVSRCKMRLFDRKLSANLTCTARNRLCYIAKQTRYLCRCSHVDLFLFVQRERSRGVSVNKFGITIYVYVYRCLSL